MRIAISSTGRQLDSNLDPRFGRAPYFIILDTETMNFEVVENTQNLNLPQGAGIQAGMTIADHHVDALITGHYGPKSHQGAAKRWCENCNRSRGECLRCACAI